MHALLCEIQIRTILQHAWAEISHEFFYKREKTIPESVRSRLRELGVLLQKIDGAFVEEIDRSSTYSEDDITVRSAQDPILTEEHLQEYSLSVLGVPLTRDHASEALQFARGLGVQTTGEFEDLMLSTLEAVAGACTSVSRGGRLELYLMVIARWIDGTETVFGPTEEQKMREYKGLVDEGMLQRLLRDIKGIKA
jgi:hypothetical protein